MVFHSGDPSQLLGHDHCLRMRRVLILAAILSLTACATPPPLQLWEKEGATPQTTGVDLVDCQQAARQEANYFGFGGFSRFGPYFGYRRFYGHSRRHPPVFRRGPLFRRGPFFWGGPYYWGPSEFGREIQLTAFCMHIKGYELVTLQPDPSQQVPTRAPGVVPGSVRDTEPEPNKDN
jgi:hypothetical protein